MELIRLDQVTKEYRVHVRDEKTKNPFKKLFMPEIKTVHAVTDLSFSIEEGELVGFIGENGAGKSTTIKMMSGILSPNEGLITVNGIIPYKQRIENAKNVGVVFGQRTRLQWDLPMRDSFDLYKEIYRIDTEAFEKNVDTFVDMLNMGSFYSTPVRQLSLGQRMKVEISLSLLHNPPILYLDEPTIGLDVFAKHQIRDFICEQNRIRSTTTILTSHDMKDLEEVCNRIVLLSKGKLLFDDTIENFKKKYDTEAVIEVVYSRQLTFDEAVSPDFEVVQAGAHKLKVSFRPHQISASAIITSLAERYEISDVSIERADIEDMVRNIYKDQMEEENR